jgi:hypothetical protein
MRDEMIIEYKDNYIHVRHYGKNNYDLSLELWRRIMAVCKQHNCFNILGENFPLKNFPQWMLSITSRY